MSVPSLRVRRSYRQIIHADPDTVFPLLCPVREGEWLDEWHYTMIHSTSGLAEEGAVFSTPSEDEADTIWIVTRHDSRMHRVEFARVTPDSRASVLKIHVRERDANSSFVEIMYIYTGLSDHGNRFIDAYTEELFRAMVTWWEKSMNYYLATGKKLLKK